MTFRFPISPNFSITGQPISRLISGNLPQPYAERVELLDVVLQKFEGVHDAHEKARAIAIASQEGGGGFALYLRNFGVEEFRYSDDPVELAYDFRSAQLEKILQAQVERTGLNLLSLRGGNDRLDEFLGSGGAVFTGQQENWQDLIIELISAAKVIVIVTSNVSEGLLTELQIIAALKKQDRTVVILRPEAKTLADVLNQEGQPEVIANIKKFFMLFPHVCEAPRLDGWKPGAAVSERAIADWPGAMRLTQLLSDDYAGKAELQAVRTVPFRILSASELESADHQSAREYLQKALRQLRVVFGESNLKAPLPKSVMGNQPDSDHVALRIAHQAFGIAAAFEQYGAMIESLAAISEIYTYFLANPMAGNAHVEYAFRLLEIRNFEGVRPQDLPESVADPNDYVREGIGNVYYAVARIWRGMGEIDNAIAAFAASVRVRELLSSLSARKGVAATLHSLGGMLHSIGRDAEAKTLIERSISMKEAIFGNQPSEELAASLHNLGSILIKLGNLAEAETVIHRSLNMKKQVFGTTHHVGIAETALLAAWLLIEAGEKDEAVPILQYAQSVFRDLAPLSPLLAQIDAILDS